MKRSTLLSIIVLAILATATGYYVYENSRQEPSTVDFPLSLNEELIVRLNSGEVLGFNFIKRELEQPPAGIAVTPITYKWDSSTKIDLKQNVYIYEGGVYIDGRKIFQCAIKVCPYHIDDSGRYLMLVNRKTYNSWFGSKILAHNTLEIIDLKTLFRMTIPSINYKGEEVNDFDLVGYVKDISQS